MFNRLYRSLVDLESISHKKTISAVIFYKLSYFRSGQMGFVAKIDLDIDQIWYLIIDTKYCTLRH